MSGERDGHTSPVRCALPSHRSPLTAHPSHGPDIAPEADLISHLLETYGYVAVLLLVGLESLGLPLPGETALLTAAAFAASGHLSIAGVIAAAVAGAILGDAGAYWIGRTGGLALVRRYGRLLRVDDAKLERAQEFFRRHGGKTVFLGRFVSLLRMLAALLAGVSRMPYPRFALFNVAGGICWALLFGTLGYGFGRHLPQLEHAVGQAGGLIALFVALVPVVVVAGRWLAAHAAELEARGESLGLHLTIGLLLSLGALWLFGGVAEDIIHHDPLTQFDLTVADLLHRHANPAMIEAAKGVTLLGSPAFIAAWGLGVAVILLVRKEYLTLAGWIASLAGASLLDMALKQVFHRPRPVWDSPLLAAQGFSFPSGHAMGSLVAYGMLVYLLVRRMDHPRARFILVGGATLLVLLIGLSRLYLGVHYFSDVIGGYAAGTVWLAACISGLEVVRRRPRAAIDRGAATTYP